MKLPELTGAMCKAARNTPAGKLLDRLIAEENARGGNTSVHERGSPYCGNVLQQLWQAMSEAAE